MFRFYPGRGLFSKAGLIALGIVGVALIVTFAVRGQRSAPKALLAQRKSRGSRGRVPGYTPSAYRRPSSARLSNLYYEREALYPTQFDYEYNYTYPYAGFYYPSGGSLFG